MGGSACREGISQAGAPPASLHALILLPHLPTGSKFWSPQIPHPCSKASQSPRLCVRLDQAREGQPQPRGHSAIWWADGRSPHRGSRSGLCPLVRVGWLPFCLLSTASGQWQEGLRSSVPGSLDMRRAAHCSLHRGLTCLQYEAQILSETFPPASSNPGPSSKVSFTCSRRSCKRSHTERTIPWSRPPGGIRPLGSFLVVVSVQSDRAPPIWVFSVLSLDPLELGTSFHCLTRLHLIIIYLFFKN